MRQCFIAAPVWVDSGLSLRSNGSMVYQARIFRQATTFIAPHGGGMTNLVLSKERTRVLELFGSNCLSTCYADIAMHKDIGL